METFITVVLAVLFGIVVLAIIFGGACLMGWLTMMTLAAFGVKAPFWGCVGAWFLLNSLFVAASRSGKSD